MGAEEKMSSIGKPVPELPVADVESAQQHYRDVLGFEIGWLYPGKEIGAVSRGDMGPIFFRKREPPFEPAVHWVFAEDIDASYQELKSSGANIVDPLEKKPWGLRQFTIKATWTGIYSIFTMTKVVFQSWAGLLATPAACYAAFGQPVVLLEDGAKK